MFDYSFKGAPLPFTSSSFELDFLFEEELLFSTSVFVPFQRCSFFAETAPIGSTKSFSFILGTESLITIDYLYFSWLGPLISLWILLSWFYDCFFCRPVAYYVRFSSICLSFFSPLNLLANVSFLTICSCLVFSCDWSYWMHFRL